MIRSRFSPVHKKGLFPLTKCCSDPQTLSSGSWCAGEEISGKSKDSSSVLREGKKTTDWKKKKKKACNFLQKTLQSQLCEIHFNKKADVKEKKKKKIQVNYGQNGTMGWKGGRKHRPLLNVKLAPDSAACTAFPPLFFSSSSGVNVLEIKAASTGAKAFPLGLLWLWRTDCLLTALFYSHLLTRPRYCYWETSQLKRSRNYLEMHIWG